jgi:hypothetical protein
MFKMPLKLLKYVYAHLVFMIHVSAAYGHLLNSLLHCALGQIVFIKARRHCHY